MKRKFDKLWLSVAALPLLGCQHAPARLAHEGPDWRPDAMAQAVVAAYDNDGDGQISVAEAEASPGWKAAFIRADATGDGQLMLDELKARINFYRDCRKHTVKAVCEVTRAGKPVAGAQVRLVPEKTVDEVLPSATGQTDKAGIANLQSDTADSAGAYAGVYQVEVMPPGATSPILWGGYEAAPDGGLPNQKLRIRLDEK